MDVLSRKRLFIETFENRKTKMTMDSAVFREDFLNDPVHQTRWNAFLKKKKALIQISLTDMMEWIQVFVGPLIDGDVKTKWDPEKGIWK